MDIICRDGSWLIPVDSLNQIDPIQINRDHAWILPDNSVWVVNHAGIGMTRIGGTGDGTGIPTQTYNTDGNLEIQGNGTFEVTVNFSDLFGSRIDEIEELARKEPVTFETVPGDTPKTPTSLDVRNSVTFQDLITPVTIDVNGERHVVSPNFTSRNPDTLEIDTHVVDEIPRVRLGLTDDFEDTVAHKQNRLLVSPGLYLKDNGDRTETLSITGGDLFRVVQTLPAEGDSSFIYLVHQNDDNPQKWGWISETWVDLGLLNVDMSQFVTNEYFNLRINRKSNTLDPGRFISLVDEPLSDKVQVNNTMTLTRQTNGIVNVFGTSTGFEIVNDSFNFRNIMFAGLIAGANITLDRGATGSTIISADLGDSDKKQDTGWVDIPLEDDWLIGFLSGRRIGDTVEIRGTIRSNGTPVVDWPSVARIPQPFAVENTRSMSVLVARISGPRSQYLMHLRVEPASNSDQRSSELRVHVIIDLATGLSVTSSEWHLLLRGDTIFNMTYFADDEQEIDEEERMTKDENN